MCKYSLSGTIAGFFMASRLTMVSLDYLFNMLIYICSKSSSDSDLFLMGSLNINCI